MADFSLTIDGLANCPFVSRQQVVDMFAFYYAGDWRVEVEFHDVSPPETKTSTYANAIALPSNSAKVNVFVRNLLNAFLTKKVIGGNNTIAPSEACAVLQALRHEIQHLNQYYHSGSTLSDKNFSFSRSKKYRSRPCEVDARASVDRSFQEIILLAGP